MNFLWKLNYFEVIFALKSTKRMRSNCRLKNWTLLLFQHNYWNFIRQQGKKRPQGVGLSAISNFLQNTFTSQASRLKDRIDSYYSVYIKNETSSASQNDDSDSQDKYGLRSEENCYFLVFQSRLWVSFILNKHLRSKKLSNLPCW